MDFVLTFFIAAHCVGLGLSTRPAGIQGPLGFRGQPGPQGSAGPEGPKGLKGPKGLVGREGPRGLQGHPGSTGPQGPEVQGPQGPTGAEYASTRGLRGPDAVAYGLLRKVRNTSARVLFQTACASVFYVTIEDESTGYGKPDLNYGINGLFTFVPEVGRGYSPPELCDAFTLQSQQQSFPLAMRFLDNKFVLDCPYLFRVTDREYSVLDNYDGNTYNGARYGECRRFFSHLKYAVETSYQPPYDAGLAYTKIVSTFQVLDYSGYFPIPELPSNLSFSVSTENDQLLTLTWTPSPDYQSSIFFADITVDPDASVENWDIVPIGVGEYTFPNLFPDHTYIAGVAYSSNYDESGIQLAYENVTVPVPEPEIFDILAAGTIVTSTIEIGPNQYTTIFNGPASWPAGLVSVSQIKSLELKFYSNILTGLPSDARVMINSDPSKLLFYMYWRAVELDSRDPNTTSQYYSTAFASVINDQTGTLGPLETNLAYDTLLISDPAHLELLFSSESGLIAPPSLSMFVGYEGSRIEINSQGNIGGTPVPVVEKFIIFYTL